MEVHGWVSAAAGGLANVSAHRWATRGHVWLPARNSLLRLSLPCNLGLVCSSRVHGRVSSCCWWGPLLGCSEWLLPAASVWLTLAALRLRTHKLLQPAAGATIHTVSGCRAAGQQHAGGRAAGGGPTRQGPLLHHGGGSHIAGAICTKVRTGSRVGLLTRLNAHVIWPAWAHWLVHITNLTWCRHMDAMLTCRPTRVQQHDRMCNVGCCAPVLSCVSQHRSAPPCMDR
jgi:hypothetical protein